MTEKRFTIVFNEQSKMMQYVDNQKEEPNRWSVWNATETANKMNAFHEENEQLKQQLFETSKELLWATSDEVDRALHYEDEVEELRKEIFE